MVIEGKVERYVEEVVSNIPAADRARAAQETTDMIFRLIRECAGERVPDILDARAVIRELGAPENVALAWIDANEGRGESAQAAFGMMRILEKIPVLKRVGPEKIVNRTSQIFRICSVLAFLLVLFGIIGIGTHISTSMLPILIGGVVALITVMGRSVLVAQNS